MTNPFIGLTQPNADIVTASQETVKQITHLARQLGVSWVLRIATISTLIPLSGIFDGDDEVLTLTNMTGNGFKVGDRAYVAIVPPSGNFAIGHASSASTAMAYLYGDMTVGNTSSTSFSAIPTATSTSILTTRFDGSRLKVDMHATLFSSAGTAVPQFALNVSGTSNPIMHRVINPANTHAMLSSSRVIGPYTAGKKILSVEWRAANGAQINVDANDWFAYTVQEVFI